MSKLHLAIAQLIDKLDLLAESELALIVAQEVHVVERVGADAHKLLSAKEVFLAARRRFLVSLHVLHSRIDEAVDDDLVEQLGRLELESLQLRLYQTRRAPRLGVSVLDAKLVELALDAEHARLDERSEMELEALVEQLLRELGLDAHERVQSDEHVGEIVDELEYVLEVRLELLVSSLDGRVALVAAIRGGRRRRSARSIRRAQLEHVLELAAYARHALDHVVHARLEVGRVLALHVEQVVDHALEYGVALVQHAHVEYLGHVEEAVIVDEASEALRRQIVLLALLVRGHAQADEEDLLVNGLVLVENITGRMLQVEHVVRSNCFVVVIQCSSELPHRREIKYVYIVTWALVVGTSRPWPSTLRRRSFDTRRADRAARGAT